MLPVRPRREEMSFLDHLEELRWRLIWSLLAIAVGAGVGFWIASHYDVLGLLVAPIRPYLHGQKLKYLSPTDPFFLTLKLGVLVGALLAFPVVLYHLWAFLSPALLPSERRLILPSLYFGLVLFAVGVAFGYFVVLPYTLRFTMSFQTDALEPAIVINEYLAVAVRLLLAFGAVFELPIVVTVLAAIGLVSADFLARKRRHALFVCAVVAAVLTPGDLVFATLLMMAPLALLYELSILLARFVTRRRAGAASTAALVLLVASASALRAQAADTVRTRPTADTTATDTLLERLRRLPGYTPVEYQADRALYRAEAGGVLRLEGKAVVRRQGDQIAADTIVYREREQRVEAIGRPTLQGQAQQVEGDRLVYDLRNRRALLAGAATTIAQGANWIVRGDVTLVGTQRLYGIRGFFTTDDRPQPAYHFEADRILILRDRLIVARPARLYFRNVPVFWLPFLVQDLRRGRRSGLLVPRFTLNDVVQTSRNQTREISNLGFYWAINDYLGLALSGGWRSNTYTSLQGDLQARWLRRRLDGYASYRRFWPTQGPRQTTLGASASWRPAERTNIALQANYASSSAFVRRTSTDPREVTRDLTSALSITHAFRWGGALILGADRRQNVANDQVSWRLPDIALALPSITLWRSTTSGGGRGGAILTLGSVGYRRNLLDVGQPTATLRGRVDETFSFGQPSLTVGNLILGAGATLSRFRVPPQRDSSGMSLPPLARATLAWNASASYRVRLIGETHLSPTLAWNGERRQGYPRRPGSGADSLPAPPGWVDGPTRWSLGASLVTNLYGFFPGIGPFAAFRHRLSPSLSYAYAPAVRPSLLQQEIFGATAGRTQSVLTLSLNQTFEAKVRRPAGPTDTVARDSARTPSVAEPQKVTILSVQTSAISYDFERARRVGRGWVTDRISNTIASDYLQGLNLTIEHDLFDETRRRGPDDLGRFAPQLSSVNLSFSLGPGTPLFRLFGLGSTSGVPVSTGQTVTRPGIVPGLGGPWSPGAMAAVTRPVGGGNWSASFVFSWTRPRPDSATGRRVGESQTLNGNFAFALTPNWSVNWSTSYSLTEGRFGQHFLTLRRDLYRWEANFVFSATPTGASAFSVVVRLKDLPELKVDYEERNLGRSGP